MPDSPQLKTMPAKGESCNCRLALRLLPASKKSLKIKEITIKNLLTNELPMSAFCRK